MARNTVPGTIFVGAFPVIDVDLDLLIRNVVIGVTMAAQ